MWVFPSYGSGCLFVCLFVKAEVMCLSADFIRGGGLSADFIRGGGGGGVLRQNSIFPAFGMYVRSKLFYTRQSIRSTVSW